MATDDLALVLREGRTALGGGDATRFPQPRMAELLGVSLRQYQRWERGVSQPRQRDVERIRAAISGGERKSEVERQLLGELATIKRQLSELTTALDALRARVA